MVTDTGDLSDQSTPDLLGTAPSPDVASRFVGFKCAVCSSTGSLDRQCSRCKKTMPHVCSHDVCKSLNTRGANGKRMEDFDDSCYCSKQRYLSAITVSDVDFDGIHSKGDVASTISLDAAETYNGVLTSTLGLAAPTSSNSTSSTRPYPKRTQSDSSQRQTGQKRQRKTAPNAKQSSVLNKKTKTAKQNNAYVRKKGRCYRHAR